MQRVPDVRPSIPRRSCRKCRLGSASNPDITAAGACAHWLRISNCRPALCIKCWSPRTCSLIGFAPSPSAQIPISRPNSWTLSACTRPARQCTGALRRRKDRDSSTGPYSASAAAEGQETAELDQRVCPPRHADLTGGLGDRQRKSNRTRQTTPHVGELSAVHERCRRRFPPTATACGGRQPQHSQERSRPALAEKASPRAFPLHPNPCL